MNMCGSYLTKTYLIISGASSCRCIGIAGCLPYNRGSLYFSPTSVTWSKFGCQLRWVRVGWGKNCPLFFFDWVGPYLIS
jgi:hypothetical protein